MVDLLAAGLPGGVQVIDHTDKVLGVHDIEGNPFGILLYKGSYYLGLYMRAFSAYTPHVMRPNCKNNARHPCWNGV